MADITKFCYKCQQTKPIDQFCRNGADSACKPCRYALNSEWVKENRSKLRAKRTAYMREWRSRKKEQDKPPTNQES